MIEGLFGSLYKEQILVFIYARQRGYAREVSKFFNIALTPVLHQLKKLEENGILVSEKQGITILYQLNPRYPFLNELKALLEKLIFFYPEDIKEKLLYNRRRPRRRSKKL